MIGREGWLLPMNYINEGSNFVYLTVIGYIVCIHVWVNASSYLQYFFGNLLCLI